MDELSPIRLPACSPFKGKASSRFWVALLLKARWCEQVTSHLSEGSFIAGLLGTQSWCCFLCSVPKRTGLRFTGEKIPDSNVTALPQTALVRYGWVINRCSFKSEARELFYRTEGTNWSKELERKQTSAWALGFFLLHLFPGNRGMEVCWGRYSKSVSASGINLPVHRHLFWVKMWSPIAKKGQAEHQVLSSYYSKVLWAVKLEGKAVRF